MGLATSFYNDRDSDLAETLVKTLLETHQVIPDFLEQYIPEGFTAEGSGDVEKLKFEADSDYGDGEGENGETPAEGGDNGGGWGAPAAPVQGAPTAAGRAAPQQPIVPAPAQPAPAHNRGWGNAPPDQTAGYGSTSVKPAPSNAGSNWGQQQAATPQGPTAQQGWGASQGFQGAPAQGPPQTQQSGWGPPPVIQPAQAPASGGWGAAPIAQPPQSSGGWGAPAPTPANKNNNNGWGPTPSGGSGW